MSFEQAIATSPYKPTIWKRFVDDTFTILDQGNVDNFLPAALNSFHNGYRDTQQDRLPRHLTSSVYRKLTHTDQYSAYDSHHSQTEKRGIVKWAKGLVTRSSAISKEKKRLSFVLVSNAYPFSFLKKLTRRPTSSREPVAVHSGSTLQRGLSGPLRSCLQQQGIRTV